MKTAFLKLGLPALLGFISVLPFVLMELVNRQDLQEAFPIPLFGIMWLLAGVFFYILISIARDAKAGKNVMTQPITLVASLACLILIAALWSAILFDQMPCFLGIPNCD